MILLALVGVVWLGYRLSLVTVPILLALLLAYLFEPLVRFTTNRKLVHRPFAAFSIIAISTLLIFVPAGLGLTFGLAQGSTFVQNQAGNIQKLLKAVDKPDDASLRAALPSHRWRSLAQWLVQQEAKAALAGAVEGAKRGVTGSDADQPKEDSTITPPTPPAPATQLAPEQQVDILSEESASNAELTTDTESNDMRPFDIVSSSVAQVTSQGIDWLREHAGDIGARAVRVGAGALGTLGRVAGSIATLLFGGFLTLFFFYFFCVSWERVLNFFRELVPLAQQDRVFSLAQRMDRVIAGFVRGRLTICVCQIVLFTLAYLIIGVPAAFIVGPIVGLLTLIPYAASLAVPVAMLLMALNPSVNGDFRDSWWWIVAAPVVVQVISQIMDDYVLTPKIQGKNTDMSMPMILFASIAGGVLGGVYGLLLAIPVAACAKILLQEIVLPRVQAWAAGQIADPLPINR